MGLGETSNIDPLPEMIPGTADTWHMEVNPKPKVQKPKKKGKKRSREVSADVEANASTEGWDKPSEGPKGLDSDERLKKRKKKWSVKKMQEDTII